MCAECPPEFTDLARRIALYIAKNDFVISGGLHIVIEDENVETHHIQWCIDNADLDEESQQFAKELLKLSLPERHALHSIAWEGAATDNGVPVCHWLWEEDDE